MTLNFEEIFQPKFEKKRKYRQMSIDNNIEILKEKLLNALIIRRQNQVPYKIN